MGRHARIIAEAAPARDAISGGPAPAPALGGDDTIWSEGALIISRLAGLLIAGALAAAMTAVVAWPILLAPSQLVYGHEIVGRHPDVHEAIVTMGGPGREAAAAHPLTSLPGWALAHVMSPVAAYNIVLLLAFPLTAMATYAFAHYLTGSHGAALIGALVFTFSPLRLAQSAYHPYVAQTEWLVLYVFALVALVDRVSLPRVAALAAAIAALVLSNGYSGVLGAFLAPIVVVSFWIIRPDADRNLWPIVWPAVVLGVATLAGAAFVLDARATEPARWALAHSIGDIGLYRARWWAYFTPSVDHPVLGSTAAAAFDRRGVNLELLELQVYVGYAFVALALVALVSAVLQWRQPAQRYVAALALVALGAAAVAAGPISGSCEPFSMAPACFAFRVVPVFRAYARFGLVVNLAVAIAAGAGAALLARRSRAGLGVAVLLLALGAFEFWPLPARAHDVLPTAGHRWLASEPQAGRILDCYPANQADRNLAQVMGRPLDHLDTSFPTCGDPELGATLAASGYSHVVVRGGQASSKLITPLPPGIAEARAFPDATVYRVTAQPPAVVTTSATGFFPYEHAGDDWWRWMAPEGSWKVRNTTATPRRVVLAVDLLPYGIPRTLSVKVDDGEATTIRLGMVRSEHVLGPWTIAPGDHVVTFKADGDPTRPVDLVESRDRRPLAVAFRNVRWTDAP